MEELIELWEKERLYYGKKSLEAFEKGNKRTGEFYDGKAIQLKECINTLKQKIIYESGK